MADPNKKAGKIPWPLVIVLFVLGLWPIALVIILLKTFEKKNQQTVTGQVDRKSSVPGSQPKAPKESSSGWMKPVGILMIVLGFLTSAEPIAIILEGYYFALEQLLMGLGLTVAGGLLFGNGVANGKRINRFTRYLAVMGDRDLISVEELARTLDLPAKKVEKDLEDMLERGYFGRKGYLNKELDYLVRSADGEEALKRKQAAAQEAPKATEDGYSGILREIRRVNDEIADPVLSAKIDRLENIAGRIFRIVEEEPEKATQISTFFNYYLPTTQKLLDSYAKFESAGIEGENLHQAKERIESTMDTIITGFEHQLDLLYKGDALDIDRDIRVMESMLNRDTASVERDFGLGASAAQKSE